MDTTSEKKKIRKLIREQKKRTPKDELKRQSRLIQEKLMALPEFQNAGHILLYNALPDEVDTKDILTRWYEKKKLYLPVIKGDDLEIVPYEGEERMVAEKIYGIPEPIGKKLQDESPIDLIVIPGMAFDSRNNRLGRGKGYYDRILKRLPDVPKIGLAFDFQMIEQVPAEPHDVKMDMILTPSVAKNNAGNDTF